MDRRGKPASRSLLTRFRHATGPEGATTTKGVLAMLVAVNHAMLKRGIAINSLLGSCGAGGRNDHAARVYIDNNRIADSSDRCNSPQQL